MLLDVSASSSSLGAATILKTLAHLYVAMLLLDLILDMGLYFLRVISGLCVAAVIGLCRVVWIVSVSLSGLGVATA